jgi:hypothetical protein
VQLSASTFRQDWTLASCRILGSLPSLGSLICKMEAIIIFTKPGAGGSCL